MRNPMPPQHVRRLQELEADIATLRAHSKPSWQLETRIGSLFAELERQMRAETPELFRLASEAEQAPNEPRAWRPA